MHRWQKRGIEPVLPFFKNERKWMQVLISSTAGVSRYVKGKKSEDAPFYPLFFKNERKWMQVLISSGEGVCRYVETEKSEDAPFYPFLILVVAAAPQQDDRDDDDPAAIVLEEIVKATAHCAFPPFCLFALSYEAGQKVVTERKFYGRKNLFD